MRKPKATSAEGRRAALVANYFEKTGLLEWVAHNVIIGGIHGDDMDDVFPPPDSEDRGPMQADFEAVGVKSRAQFEKLAVAMPATVLGVLRGNVRGNGTNKQKACVLMLGWQLGCELIEWMGGTGAFFETKGFFEGKRDEDLEDVEEAYRAACAMLRMSVAYVGQ